MRRPFTLFFLPLALLLLGNFASAIECDKVIRDSIQFSAFEGTDPQHLHLNEEEQGHIPKGAEISLLGKGYAGGIVYKIKPDDGKTFVLKKYNSDFAFREDLERITVLRNALKSVSSTSPNTEHFSVVEATIAQKNLMKLNYVPGLTLAYLTSTRSPLSDESKKFLRDTYKRKIKNLMELLTKEHIVVPYENFQGRFDLISRNDPLDIHQIYIHDLNIIVSPNSLDMTIIDPF